MDVESFFKQLDKYFSNNELDKVEPYLISSLESANKSENYAAYIAIGNEMIGFYRSTSQFKQAFDIAEDILLLMEELQLENSEHFATTLLNTATAYRAAGNTEQAYKYYRQALNIYNGLLPADDYRFAGLYNNMSILLEQMNENEEAVKLLQQALAIVKNLENSESEQATTLTNLALLYFKLDKTEEAAASLKEALSIFEKTKNDMQTDAHYSAALAGIGEAYYRMGNYGKALTAYEKALLEVQKHFGENQSYAVLCENCAAVCQCLKETDKENWYRKRAQDINKKINENI